MLKDYSKEEIWRLYENLPEELKEAIFSEIVAEDLYKICKRNKIKDCPKLSKIVGYVFLGLLPPEKLKETLKSELFLTSKESEEVFQEIERFVFFPYRRGLSILYGKKIEEPFEEKQTTEEKIDEKEIRDIYREPIE